VTGDIENDFTRSANLRQEILDQLRAPADSRDVEAAHGEADALILRYLREVVNVEDLARAFEAVGKWHG
jgi:hypothetical protein